MTYLLLSSVSFPTKIVSFLSAIFVSSSEESSLSDALSEFSDVSSSASSPSVSSASDVSSVVSLADYKCDDKSKYGLDKPYATITVDYQEEVADDDTDEDTQDDTPSSSSDFVTILIVFDGESRPYSERSSTSSRTLSESTDAKADAALSRVV